ncbi:MAG: transposase, partial [Bacteroidota bacterium]
MGQLLGSNRNQFEFFCLESAITEVSPVRAIEVLVEILPLSDLGFIERGQRAEGRPAYSSTSMLKLYLYGYFNRVRSSRRLERECQTNLEAIWLMRGLRPCFRTISGFRQENAKALQKSFAAFNRFLRNEELFSKEEVATDGSKIRGQNSRKNNYNEKKVNQHLTYIDNQISNYLDQLDQVDLSEEEEHQEEKQIDLAEKLDLMTERRKKYEALSEQIDAAHEAGQTQISTTDPDVRALPVKLSNVEVGYNVVATAESKNKLITNFEVRNTSDTYALSKAAMQAREALGLKPEEKLRQLADKGFDTGSELKICLENNIKTYVGTKKRFIPRVDKAFGKDKFCYDDETDTYTCPAGQVMTTPGTLYTRKTNKLHKPYQAK